MQDPSWPWDLIQAIGSIATAAVAWWQISSLKNQQKGWKTLEACERYESDPVLHDVLLKLRDARDSGQLYKTPRTFRAETATLMNYLDGIAIGQAQGFYNKAIVRDHLEGIMKDHVGEFLSPDLASRMELDTTGFARLRALIAEWDNARPWYKF
jgi:hypothetical protein